MKRPYLFSIFFLSIFLSLASFSEVSALSPIGPPGCTPEEQLSFKNLLLDSPISDYVNSEFILDNCIVWSEKDYNFSLRGELFSSSNQKYNVSIEAFVNKESNSVQYYNYVSLSQLRTLLDFVETTQVYKEGSSSFSHRKVALNSDPYILFAGNTTPPYLRFEIRDSQTLESFNVNPHSRKDALPISTIDISQLKITILSNRIFSGNPVFGMNDGNDGNTRSVSLWKKFFDFVAKLFGMR